MRRFAIFVTPAVVRSKVVCDALAQGMRAHGDEPTLIDEREYGGALDSRFDGCAFYSLRGNLRTILTRTHEGGRPAVFVDMGYWNRKPTKEHTRDVGSVYEGYHRFAVGERHAVSTLQRREHSSDRFRRQQELDPSIRVMPWRNPGDHEAHVVLCGMQPKAAAVYDLEPCAWERWAIGEIKRHTSRRIVYRPKPSWDGAYPLDGADMSFRGRSLQDDLVGAWAVVTHHSNAAIDAVCEGVPIYGLEDGVAHWLSHPINCIESAELRALADPARLRFLHDVAYCQWSVAEMRSGHFWQHLKDEDLLDTVGDAKRIEGLS